MFGFEIRVFGETTCEIDTTGESLSLQVEESLDQKWYNERNANMCNTTDMSCMCSYKLVCFKWYVIHSCPLFHHVENNRKLAGQN
jgi:hypothetical protein